MIVYLHDFNQFIRLVDLKKTDKTFSFEYTFYIFRHSIGIHSRSIGIKFR